MVAAAEGAADGGKGGVGELAGEVHGELAGPNDLTARLADSELVAGDPERLARELLDLLDGQALRDRARRQRPDRGRASTWPASSGSIGCW